MSKRKKIESDILDRIETLFGSFDKDLDALWQELKYIKRIVDESSRHNSKLVESYKQQTERYHSLVKWLATIIIVLLTIILTLLGINNIKIPGI